MIQSSLSETRSLLHGILEEAAQGLDTAVANKSRSKPPDLPQKNDFGTYHVSWARHIVESAVSIKSVVCPPSLPSPQAPALRASKFHSSALRITDEQNNGRS